MKIGALILGIVGGLVALLYGLLGYGLGSIADMSEAGSGTNIKIASIVLPIAALVGSGMVMAKPIVGATLMAVVAISFAWILGFNTFSMVPVILLGVGAVLGFLGSRGNAGKVPQSIS